MRCLTLSRWIYLFVYCSLYSSLVIRPGGPLVPTFTSTCTFPVSSFYTFIQCHDDYNNFISSPWVFIRYYLHGFYSVLFCNISTLICITCAMVKFPISTLQSSVMGTPRALCHILAVSNRLFPQQQSQGDLVAMIYPGKQLLIGVKLLCYILSVTFS